MKIFPDVADDGNGHYKYETLETLIIIAAYILGIWAIVDVIVFVCKFVQPPL